jgi:hypothetical protein
MLTICSDVLEIFLNSNQNKATPKHGCHLSEREIHKPTKLLPTLLTRRSHHHTAEMENENNTLVTVISGTIASKLLRSEKYSDLTILCHGREFKTHKAILCPRSEVISKMCDADMQESKTGKIEDEEFDDDTMERMIDFAYEGDYQVTRPPKYLLAEEAEPTTKTGVSSLEVENERTTGGVTLPRDDAATPALEEDQAKLSPTDQRVIHARVYALAEYYEMSELRDHACNRFRRVADDDLDPKGFIKAARAICGKITRDDGSLCTSYDSPLRAAFLSNIAFYAPKLALDPDFVAALYEPNLHDVSADIFCALAQRISSLETDNETLQQSVTTIKENTDEQVSMTQHRQRVAEEQLQHNEGVTQRLVKSLRNLPASCGNQNCGNESGSLKFERNGNGDWQVRCGAKKCRCKLN